MAFSIQQQLEIIEVMENYLDRIRPDEELRKKVDIGYRVEGLSVYIVEILPMWNNPEETHESRMAKATWVKKRSLWKVFWPRANLKWENYPPCPFVKTLAEFVDLVEEDRHHCFWG